MKRLRNLVTRIDARTLRERCIGLLVSLLVLLLAWDIALVRPLDVRREGFEGQVNQLHQQIRGLNAQIGQIALARTTDPDRLNGRKAQSLSVALAGVETELARATEHLVPPGEMAELLEAVLTRETRLQLVKLEGLGAEPLFAPDLVPNLVSDLVPDLQGALEGSEQAGSMATVIGLYRHGLRIDFEGGYLDTLQYLVALENLQWRFLWDNVSYEVSQYPVARVSITVYSLSLDDAWIGV